MDIKNVKEIIAAVISLPVTIQMRAKEANRRNGNQSKKRSIKVCFILLLAELKFFSSNTVVTMPNIEPKTISDVLMFPVVKNKNMNNMQSINGK